MPRFNPTRATIGCYPVWATDTDTRDQVDTVTSRLIELAHNYHADTLKSNAAAAKFVRELLDALHTENPVTLSPLIERYHINSELDKLLRLADSAKRGEDVSKQFSKAATHIKTLNKANSSPYHPAAQSAQSHQDIIDAANKLNPKLSVSSIAEILAKRFPLSVGTIRNILNPLRIK